MAKRTFGQRKTENKNNFASRETLEKGGMNTLADRINMAAEVKMSGNPMSAGNKVPKFGYGNQRTLVDHAYDDVQHRYIVDRTKADIPLYNEIVAGLSVPSSSFLSYEKSKKRDFNIKQLQRQLISAEKFTLSDNFVKMAVSLSFSYPRYLAQLMPKAIPCFDNLWIEWSELARFDALQEEFAKLGLAADTNRDSCASRIGYHVQRVNDSFSYVNFVCDARTDTKTGKKHTAKIGIPAYEWSFLNDANPLSQEHDDYFLYGLGTAYSKFHKDDEGMPTLQRFAKNFRFYPSESGFGMWGDVSRFSPEEQYQIKENFGHGMDGDLRFLVAVFSLLNYPRYVSAVLPAPKKVSTIRWGRRVPRNEIKVVEIDLPKKGVNVYGQLFTGHGSPKRQHARRGHPRRYRDKTGKVIKKIWIEPKVVGNPELGIINHEYVLQVQKDRRRKGLQN